VTTGDEGHTVGNGRGHTSGQRGQDVQCVQGSWAKRHLVKHWWVYGLLLVGVWVMQSQTRHFSWLTTVIGVVPVFVLGVAAVVLRMRREARTIGGDIDINDVPELETLMRRRQVPDDPTKRERLLTLVRWRQRRTRVAWPVELVVLILFYMALGVLLVFIGRPVVGMVFGGIGVVVIGVGGYLMMRFGQRRLNQYEDRLSAAH
jgi:hypothetical protein